MGLLLCFVLTVGNSNFNQGITANTRWQQLLQLFWLALQGSFGLYFKGIRMFVCPVIAKSQCVCHRCESQNYIVDTCDVTDKVLKLESTENCVPNSSSYISFPGQTYKAYFRE